jgi:hypothetical protein
VVYDQVSYRIVNRWRRPQWTHSLGPDGVTQGSPLSLAHLLLGLHAPRGEGGGRPCHARGCSPWLSPLARKCPRVVGASRAAHHHEVHLQKKKPKQKKLQRHAVALTPRIGQVAKDGDFAFTITNINCGVTHLGTSTAFAQAASGRRSLVPRVHDGEGRQDHIADVLRLEPVLNQRPRGQALCHKLSHQRHRDEAVLT